MYIVLHERVQRDLSYAPLPPALLAPTPKKPSISSNGWGTAALIWNRLQHLPPHPHLFNPLKISTHSIGDQLFGFSAGYEVIKTSFQETVYTTVLSPMRFTLHAYIRQQVQATALRSELAAVRQELVSLEKQQQQQQEDPTSPIGGRDVDLKSPPAPPPAAAVAETLREEETSPRATTGDDDGLTWRGRYEHLAGLFADQTKELNEKVRCVLR